MTHKYFFGYSGKITQEQHDRAFGRGKIESAKVIDMGEDHITFEGPPYVVTGEAIAEYKRKMIAPSVILCTEDQREEAEKLIESYEKDEKI